FGDKPRGEKPAYGDNRGPKKFGDRKFGDKPYGERKSGDKPAGDRRFADKKSGDRRFGDKPYKPGFRKHDDKPASYPKFTPEKQIGEMRLNRFLAQSGLCSRREADDFITAGLVTVNGQIVTQLGTKVLPTDEVKFNDSRVQGEKKVYLVLNKPKGYVTSLDDPHAGKTVMELVQGACTERIYPVGRLDKNSLGLLLFTNDGDLTKQLTHPAFRKKKIYQVSLDKPLTRAEFLGTPVVAVGGFFAAGLIAERAARFVAVAVTFVRTGAIALPFVAETAARFVECGTVVLRKVGVIRRPLDGLAVIGRLLRIGSITLQTRATLDTLRRSGHGTLTLVASETRKHRGRVVFKVFHNQFECLRGKVNRIFRIKAYCMPDSEIKAAGRYKFAAFALSLHP
ncbi:pseudouridine synthase, partial [Alistipes finegoldii]|uniref:pseudouridine synthase n=1 Tax=Alistipes finegoldii TaxID=214856 RepID=UPI0025A439EB